MKRSIGQWQALVPDTAANQQSNAAIFWCITDAREDILLLHARLLKAEELLGKSSRAEVREFLDLRKEDEKCPE